MLEFLRWLLRGCPIECAEGRRVVCVRPLGSYDEWRHKDDGSLCWAALRHGGDQHHAD